MADEKKPEIIEDENLDDASGGLLPAIQKVREAASVQADPPSEAASLNKAGTGTVVFSSANAKP